MMSTGMYSGAGGSMQLQGMIAQNAGPIDYSRYMKRAKEPQIVRVKTKEAQTFVSIPFLADNYANIADQMDKPDEVHFQIRNFRYRNYFDNVPVNAKVDILSDTYYMTKETQQTRLKSGIYDQAAYNGRFPTLNLNNTSAPISVTASELVDILNTQVQLRLHEIMSEFVVNVDWRDWVNDPANNNMVNFYNIFAMSKFNFDTYTGHLVIETRSLNNVDLRSFIPERFAPSELEESFLYRYTVQLQTSDENEKETQGRITTLLGLTDSITYADQGQLIAPSSIITLTTYQQTEFDTQKYHPYTFIRYMKKLDSIGFATPYYKVEEYWSSEAAQFEIYMMSKSPMKMLPMEEIQIRTSLNTNIWETAGRRSDILCTVPLIGGPSSAPIDYMPPGSESRVYNARDSSASLRSFKLLITDELGNELKFKEPYELTLAIFYC